MVRVRPGHDHAADIRQEFPVPQRETRLHRRLLATGADAKRAGSGPDVGEASSATDVVHLQAGGFPRLLDGRRAHCHERCMDRTRKQGDRSVARHARQRHDRQAARAGNRRSPISGRHATSRGWRASTDRYQLQLHCCTVKPSIPLSPGFFEKAARNVAGLRMSQHRAHHDERRLGQVDDPFSDDAEEALEVLLRACRSVRPRS